MIIQDGEYYMTRDGRVAGPADSTLSHSPAIAFTVPLDGHPATYWNDGTRYWPGIESGEDLVMTARNPKEPIQETVKRELVDGIYGRISIGEHEPGKGIYIGLVSNDGDEELRRVTWTKDELRDVIHILNQVAEFLDGK